MKNNHFCAVIFMTSSVEPYFKVNIYSDISNRTNHTRVWFGRFGKPVLVWCKTNDQTASAYCQQMDGSTNRFKTETGLVRTNRPLVSPRHRNPGNTSRKICCCYCLFGFNVAFNNFSVISRRRLVATGSSMLTFIVLPH